MFVVQHRTDMHVEWGCEREGGKTVVPFDILLFSGCAAEHSMGVS